MSSPENEIELPEGEPGGEVDEKLVREKSVIRFTICDNDGKVLSLSYFRRGISPEEISQSLNECADDLEEDPPLGVSPQLIKKLVFFFRKHAREVPGLNE